MAVTSELPTILWMLMRNFFQRDAIMDVTKINYDDTLNLREWKGEDYVDYESVAVARDPFSKCAVLNVSVGDRAMVSFIDGSKDEPVVMGIIQGGN